MTTVTVITTDPNVPVSGDVQTAYLNYHDFEENKKAATQDNFDSLLSLWMTQVDQALSAAAAGKGSGNYDQLLQQFFAIIMAGGSVSADVQLKLKAPREPEHAYVSILENQQVELADELNYASAYRDTIAYMKSLVVSHPAAGSLKGGADPVTVIKQVLMSEMDLYRDPNKFSATIPEIFQNSDASFSQFENTVNGVLNKIGLGTNPATGQPYLYSDLNDLYTKASQVPAAGTTNQAANDYQTLLSGVDNGASAVGTQSNVLNTQLQDLLSTTQSLYASITQALSSLFVKPKDYFIQHQIAG